jgi:subtilase family serine protease
MHRFIRQALLGAAIAFGAAQVASAQSDNGLAHRNDNATYHVPACPGPAADSSARCHAHIVTDSKGNPKVWPNYGPGALPPGFGPSDLRNAYGVSTADNTGTIVIVDANGYSTAEADMNVYRQMYGIPLCQSSTGCFTKLNQRGKVGADPKDNTGWDQEAALDLEMASAMCPSCKIVLVQADSASFANLAAAVNTAANVPNVKAISNSYGGGELFSQFYESAYNHSGIAITASSGDSGYGVEFPASSPHVTAVGGTSLKVDSSPRGWSETVWSGAGSGCSSTYAKPTWQTDTGCRKRTVADVSAVADPNTGVAVYGPTNGNGRGWMVFGGTSVAAPITAAMYALNGNAATYGSNPYKNTSFLNDVTSGSNGSCGGTYLCTAVVGYDGPTGLGTPKGANAY